MVVDPAGAGAGFAYTTYVSANTASGLSGAMSMQPTYSYAGAEWIFRGKVVLPEATFDSDRDYGLTFKMIKDEGFVYLCGRGTVTRKNGKTIRLGYEDTVDTWLPYLTSDEVLKREAAAQALGELATTKQDRERVTPGLVRALKDDAFEVRRNAAEALGKIGDTRAVQALTPIADGTGEFDDWVRAVAADALKSIKH